MDLILIRHAQSKGNKASIVQGQTDEGLSDFGMEQANKLSNYFNPKDINAIYSSDLDRAVQTAEPTAKKLNLKITKDPDLREAHFGIWEGLTFEEVKTKYQTEYSTWHADYFVRPEWFESFESHFSRTKKAIQKILLNHHQNDTVAVFTHGGNLKTQIGFFNKLNGAELIAMKNVNCSLMLLKFDSTTEYEKGQLVYYNKQVI